MVYVQGENENRAMETVEKHNCRFSTVTTAPTAANKEKQHRKTPGDRLHKILDASILWKQYSA